MTLKTTGAFLISVEHLSTAPFFSNTTISMKLCSCHQICSCDISDYRFMGGVDHADQMLCYILRQLKVRRWYVPAAMHAFRTAVCNTHVIKQSILIGEKKKRYMFCLVHLSSPKHICNLPTPCSVHFSVP